MPSFFFLLFPVNATESLRGVQAFVRATGRLCSTFTDGVTFVLACSGAFIVGVHGLDTRLGVDAVSDHAAFAVGLLLLLLLALHTIWSLFSSSKSFWEMILLSFKPFNLFIPSTSSGLNSNINMVMFNLVPRSHGAVLTKLHTVLKQFETDYCR